MGDRVRNPHHPPAGRCPPGSPTPCQGPQPSAGDGRRSGETRGGEHGWFSADISGEASGNKTGCSRRSPAHQLPGGCPRRLSPSARRSAAPRGDEWGALMLSSVAPPRTPALLAALPASVSLYSPARWQHPASQLCSRQAGGGSCSLPPSWQHDRPRHHQIRGARGCPPPHHPTAEPAWMGAAIAPVLDPVGDFPMHDSYVPPNEGSLLLIPPLPHLL